MMIELGNLALPSKKKVKINFVWAVDFKKPSGLTSFSRLFNSGMKAIYLEFKVDICDGTEYMACFSDVIHS